MGVSCSDLRLLALGGAVTVLTVSGKGCEDVRPLAGGNSASDWGVVLSVLGSGAVEASSSNHGSVVAISRMFSTAVSERKEGVKD